MYLICLNVSKIKRLYEYDRLNTAKSKMSMTYVQYRDYIYKKESRDKSKGRIGQLKPYLYDRESLRFYFKFCNFFNYCLQ